MLAFGTMMGVNAGESSPGTESRFLISISLAWSSPLKLPIYGTLFPMVKSRFHDPRSTPLPPLGDGFSKDSTPASKVMAVILVGSSLFVQETIMASPDFRSSSFKCGNRSIIACRLSELGF